MKIKFKKNSSLKLIIFLSIFAFLFFPNRFIRAVGLSALSFILFNFLYVRKLMKSLVVERRVSKLKIACREKVDIEVVVKNYSKLTAHICYIFDDAPYLQVYKNENCQILQLRPNEITKIKYQVSARERGLFFIGPVKVKLSDPFGLFNEEIEIDNKLEIMVRPARIKLITEAFPGLPQGALKINNAIYEDITHRRSVRPYMTGDEPRRINWRISAKQGELFTNLYENTFDTTFFVFLNLAEEEYELHSRFYDIEKAVEIAASIVEKARELHQRVGFAAYGTDFPYCRPAQNQYDQILDTLALIKPEKGKMDFDPYKYYKSQLPNSTIFFIVGPEEVRQYFIKVEANKEEITAENIGSFRRQSIGA